MNMKHKIVFAAFTLAAASAQAGRADAESTVLSTQSGMTVYTFDRDSGGQSRCEDACTTIWTPVRPADIDGNGIQIMVRGDGSQQAVYNGEPLYLFIADRKAGERKGDNVDNVWHVVPTGARVVQSVRRSSGYSSGYWSGGNDGCGY